MDVVVSSRHCEVSDRFREHVEEKLARLEKHDHRIIRVEVLLEKEPRPREPERAVRVELTALSKGPIVRAEASAEDKMAALDLALDKMASQMRRAADRRKVHRGQHAPESRRPGDGPQRPAGVRRAGRRDGDRAQGRSGDGDRRRAARGAGEDPRRRADDLEQALYEMELVGHDFYLFVDKESERPSVVYRRRGYDYGVISLDLT